VLMVRVGSAFKFLPVLGKYVANGLENSLSKSERERWAFRPTDRAISRGDGSRAGPPRRILSSSEQAKL
jgi:sarcosine oxidase/L-pipecolate oxidase